MLISYKGNTLEVKAISKERTHAQIVGVGKRKLYEDVNSQRYVKCFSKWWKFPQEVDY